METANRFDMFTRAARRALMHAQEEAQRLKHDYIGTEHLLLGLAHDPASTAGQALSDAGIWEEPLHEAMGELLGTAGAGGEVGLTPRAKRVIEWAVAAANREQHHFVATAHLLIGLLDEGEGPAVEALERLGVDTAALRQSAREQLASLDAVARESVSERATIPNFPVDPKLLARCTVRARRVIALSAEEAKRFNHDYIGTEHLLLGLVREGGGVAAEVLAKLGVRQAKVRAAVEFIAGRGARQPAEHGLTPRARKVLELAWDEAMTLGHEYIGTEHLLLGLVREGEGIAAGVLESLGVKLEVLRARTLDVLLQRSGGEPADPWWRTGMRPVNLSPYAGPVANEPALANLRQVVGVNQVQRSGSASVALLSMELYADGFIVAVRWSGLRSGPGVVPPVTARATDATGQTYTGMLGTRSRSRGDWRLTFAFAPGLPEGISQLELELTWQHADQEATRWTFTVKLPRTRPKRPH